MTAALLTALDALDREVEAITEDIEILERDYVASAETVLDLYAQRNAVSRRYTALARLMGVSFNYQYKEM